MCLSIAVVGGYGCTGERHPGAGAPAPHEAADDTVAGPRFARGVAHLSLIAGDGVAGFLEGVPARFSDPWGVVVAGDGRIFVADAGDNDRIRAIDRTGRSSAFSGSVSGFVDGPAATARFDTPSGLAIDTAGVLYVADTGNDAIRRVDAQGTVTTLAGGHGRGDRDGYGRDARFNGPLGVAVSDRGDIYVADTYNHRIRRIDARGTVTTLAGGTPGFQDGPAAQARFDTPCSLAVDPDGSIWVADTRNRAIRRIAPDGTVSTLAQSAVEDYDAPLRRPLGIVADADAVYVTEAAHGRVLRYGYDGTLQTMTGEDPSQALSQPASLAFDGRHLVVTDAAAARIYRVDDTAPSHPPAPVGPAPGAPLPATEGRWPIAPQDAWHEIVGVPGEVRGNDRGESRDHLHAGLDVRADVGAEVHAIADAKVSDPLATWGFGKLNEGLAIDRIDYIHMRVGRNARGQSLDPQRFVIVAGDDGKPGRVQVRRGTRFRAGDVLGTVNAMAHTHLALTGNVGNRNAFELGFIGFVDHVLPTIDAVEFRDASGTVLRRKAANRLLIPRNQGGIQIVVEAWDQVDGNLARRRLGLYAVGYQVLTRDGTPAPGFEQPRMNIVFDSIPTDDAATRVIYAPDSGETVHGSVRTRFLYAVTHVLRHGEAREGAWDAQVLPPGDYLVRIIARDWSGNIAERRRDVPVTLQ
ncbi:SMP-30/gluconolactonase/LRE family protein [Luteibacter sp. dw_328]|uniref:SMP-30/gluconolactonase/LRE family protein n=1 Tax=Luteibacter sp. dw_328 TaxID=2719796 RepID=UPI001BD1FC55|nr:SMP-30/gluconolactonase/LRE family protein [Luteibacter sp. dw_328]